MLGNQQATFFEKLTESRRGVADSLDQPCVRGVITSDQYSDQAHFIYELLQNADDAKATSARFELFENKLLFAHDGTRHFSVSDPLKEDHDREHGTLGDINAITSYGNSNKNGETRIGKFGVGFKAVFQYTTTPHIYSRDIFFRIEKHIVPIQLEEDYPDRKEDETLFIFPFANDKQKEAYNEIDEKLHSLEYPLLFLPNLKNIKFKVSNKLGLYGKEVIEEQSFNGTRAELVTLTQNDDGNREELNGKMLWIFTRNNDKYNAYSVGFFVNDKWRLQNKKKSAFCFFPTKETTGLNFIIHAPFLTTKNREGILAGMTDNHNMISLLSALAADSLVYLRDIGQSKRVPLIDDNILDIVPCNESEFGEVPSKNTISFKPFYEAIRTAFCEQEIIPTLENGYVKSTDAYWGGRDNSQLAKVFSNDQLAVLTGNKKASWAFASLGAPSTSSEKLNYIQEIIHNKVSATALVNKINNSFIEVQKIEWLHTFYKYMSENGNRTTQAKTMPVFLNQNKKAAAAFDEKKQALLFLPIRDGSGYDTVNEDLLKNKDTTDFINKIGIRNYSLCDEINIILKQLNDNTPINTLLSYFKKFFLYYQECPLDKAKSFLSDIGKYDFALYTSLDNETTCRGKPGEFYFPCKPLKEWFETKPKTKFLDYNEYLKLVGEDKKDDLKKFFTDLGVKDVQRVFARPLSEKEYSQIENPPHAYSTQDNEWTVKEIDGCEEVIDKIVKEKNADLSELLWSELLKFVKIGYINDSSDSSENNVLYIRFFSRKLKKQELFESNVAKRLRTERWLQNAKGDFVSAKELTKQTLHSRYDRYDLSKEETDKLYEILKINFIEGEIRIKNDEIAEIAISYDDGISESDQREANRESKEIVKERLESEGFEFTNGIDGFSTIDGVIRDGIEYPLVVKSYKYQGAPLKIGAKEWIQLMRPNSVFCVHFGNRKIGYLELGTLLRTKDKLTISFRKENLDEEDRLEKFAELLQYFGNVHFNFNSVMPSKVANDFRHFSERRTEEDLTGDDDSLL